jgi:dihydrofolate synthase/folylpolyglutamate synthase
MSDTALHKQLIRRGLFRIKPGLQRVRAICTALGNPQNAVPVIHIAGTNGKGSVAACLESILRHAGYRTGLYISPHLRDVRERIQIDRRPITGARFDALAERLLQAEREADLTLTYFEFLTVMAYQAFADSQVDVAVVETGMGGRWDATNIVSHPILTMITSIGLDHTQWLGPTESAIATEKAGILKPKAPLVSGVRGTGAAVIRVAANRLGIAYLEIDKDFKAATDKIVWHLGRQTVRYKSKAQTCRFETALLGNYQADNVGVTLAGIELLNQQGWVIADDAIREGLANVSWPGRFELSSADSGVRILFDGAHNPPAMKRFLNSLQESPWRDVPKIFVFGVYRDKDYVSLLRLIEPHADRILFCSLSGSRTLPARDAAAAWTKSGGRIVNDPATALQTAIHIAKREELIVVTGSLALVGQLHRQPVKRVPCPA